MEKNTKKLKRKNYDCGTKKFKGGRGITLIALVITIIVLLILAGVSIATLTGDNGILTQAAKAKEKTQIASVEEQRKLAQAEANMNTTETTYNGVTIPAYCAPTRIDGENTIDDGLVIIDKNGNEWVWIEVPQSIYTNTAYNGGTAPTDSEDYYSKIESVMQAYASAYRDGSFSDTWYSEAQHGFKDADEYNNYKNNMLKSVYENGGFYIGRYEVGTQTARFAETNDSGLTTPFIKQDVYPYNFVTCKQAQKLANQLAIGGKTSSLLFGIQWDLAMKFIEEKGKLIDGTKVTPNMLTSDSRLWGNYKNINFDITRGQYTTSPSTSGSWTDVTTNYTKPKDTSVLLTTGATNRNSTLNIYDLAGNVWEWTLEQYTADTDYPCSRRGGSNHNDGGNYPASRHSYRSTTYAYDSIGFRSALY